MLKYIKLTLLICSVVLVISTDSPEHAKCKYAKKHAWRTAINEHKNATSD
jgi:hypothetical protein